MAPEAPPGPAAPSRGGPGAESHNPLKRKIGPLPTWVWVLIVAVLIVGWAWWHNKNSGASSSSTDSTGDTTDASQVPQFVNQTFVQPGPPSAPNPVPGPVPVTAPGSPQIGEKVLTVPRSMTLKQFAKEHHWSDVTLAAVETLNHLKPGARLKKGQKIKRPWAPIQPGQTPLPGAA